MTNSGDVCVNGKSSIEVLFLLLRKYHVCHEKRKRWSKGNPHREGKSPTANRTNFYLIRCSHAFRISNERPIFTDRFPEVTEFLEETTVSIESG